MKIRLLFLLFVVLGTTSVFSQKTTEEEYVEAEKNSESKPKSKTPFKDRLVFGGNLGGAFGTFSYFQINPMVGYKVTDWWVNGVGFNYIYSGSRGFTQNIYGPSVWSRAYVYQGIMLHTEFEYLTLNLRAPNGNSYNGNAPVWLVGGGYQSTSNGIGFGLLVLFDLIQHHNSPYSSPIFRVGGMIGF